jgi:hypothetical protein
MDESEPNPRHALTVIPADKPLRISRAIAAEIIAPAIVADAGDQAARRFFEFFGATIRKKHSHGLLPRGLPVLRLVRNSSISSRSRSATPK